MKDAPAISLKNNFILATSYALWGLFPIYWYQLEHIHAHEILFHRIIWSFFFFLATYVILFARSKRKEQRSLNPFKELGPKDVFRLFISSALITANWFLYIYAVNSHQVLQGSLAYYLSPLISILLGYFFYSESISLFIRWAFGFCSLGVLFMISQGGELPLLSLALALTFSGYGFIKKKIKIHAIQSSLIESSFLIVPSFYLAFYSPFQSLAQFSTHDWIYLILGGIVTGVPIVLFSYSAQKVPLTTIGFFQYISPTLQFLSAIFFLREPLSQTKLIAFVFIWIGAGIYLYSLKHKRSSPQ